jgi:hypothetical protein
MKTKLLVDVDGVLNAWSMPMWAWEENGYVHDVTPQWGGASILYNPNHGKMLLDFAEAHDMALCWATAWEHGANDYVAPLVGLPELPVLHCYPQMHGRLWKFGPIADQVRGCAVAWLDDQFANPREVSEEIKQGFIDSRPEPTLLVPIDDTVGLIQADLDKVAAWQREREEVPV